MHKYIMAFFIALGVVLGGAVSAGLAAVLTGESPLKTILDISMDIKLWAIAVAMGGTFSSLKLIETGLFTGQFYILLEQFFLIFCGFLGAQIAYLILSLLLGG